MLKFVCATAVALVLGGTAAAAPPIEAYGKLPVLQDVRVSPDGSAVAYLKTSGDRRQLLVQRLDGAVEQTVDTGAWKVRDLMWLDPDHVVVIASSTVAVPETIVRDEFLVGYSVNIRTGKSVRLMDRGSRDVYNVLLGYPVRGTYGGRPVAYAAGWTTASAAGESVNEGANTIDIYRVDLDSGFATLHKQGGRDLSRFVISPEGEVVATERRSNDRGEVDVATAAGVRAVAQRAAGAIEGPSLAGFGRSRDTVLVSEPVAPGDWRYVEVSRKDGAALGPVDDERVVDELLHADDGRLVGLSYVGTYPDYLFFEPALAKAWALVKQAFPDMDVSIENWSDDFAKVVVRVDGSGEPGAWYLIDAAAKHAARIGRERPDIAPADVAEVRAVRFRAADGLSLNGYLTLPPGREPKNLPLVAFVHGGPASRDTAEFDYFAQAMASRGYAVLQVNFRGSGDLGEKLLHAGYGEWGRKMQSDVSDGVAALVKDGVVDPKRVCIAGGSYGGYAALAGVTLQQGVYRCAVSIAGVSDLPKMLEYERQAKTDSRSPEFRYWLRYMGAQSGGDPKLAALSPDRLAAKVQAPVLLIHGKDDTVVSYDQSVMMQNALRAAGKPVSFVTLPGEDHWLSREATRVETLKAMITFLEKENPPT